MIPKEVVIIGGGSSIQEGISKGLWKFLEGKFTIGCNYSYRHFLPTVATFVDRPFFHERKKELLNLPLVIGKGHTDILVAKKNNQEAFKNVLLCKTTSAYFGKDAIKKDKVFSAVLVGLFSITISICLGIKTIYLLGFDWTKKTVQKDRDQLKRPITHYYQKDEALKHRGIGKTSYYDSHEPKELFKYFLKEQDLKIYNVSLNSNIDCFEKLSYEEFFTRLTENYNQEELRNEIKKTILDMQKLSKGSSK